MAPFNHLERQVLERIAAQYPDIQSPLLEQFDAATITSRENTGHGFFTDFSVDRSRASPVSAERVIGNVSADVKDVQYGMGFILFLEDGYACMLEGFGYGDDVSDVSFEHVEFTLRDIFYEKTPYTR